jgi:hypothetical protein
MRRDIIWMVKCIFEQMNASVKAVTLPKKKEKKTPCKIMDGNRSDSDRR